MRVLIVGGVAGGGSTAARLRRLDEEAEIILFERGEYISFANCGLPYYIGGVIEERENLLVVKPELMKNRFNIDVRVKSEVVEIDPQEKKAVVLDHRNNNRYTLSYDKLVLSPGASPIRPPLPGINSSRIYTLRNIPDTDAIVNELENGKVKRAVVIGGGFIGLEMVENLHHRGLQVSLVEMAPQVMAPLDYEMAAIIHQHLKVKQIPFFLKDGVKGFEENKTGIVTTLESGRTIEADMVVLAIGVRPEVKLAKDAGLETARGIIVNEKMETSDPDIYAIGDAVEVQHLVCGTRTLIPLAWPANKQGRIVADRICGLDSVYRGSQGTAIAKVFDLTVASTGCNEKNLQDKDIDYGVSFTHSAHHAGYYPGAIPMSIKLIFDNKDGRVLGAQIVGIEGVDKRIDVLAVAIRNRMTVFDLEELELAYAPPYSSAKDPVIMAGFVAANIMRGAFKPIQWHEIAEKQANKGWLLDVRTREEFELGTIEGSTNIPVDELRERINEIPTDLPIIVFCQVGLRGYVACRILEQHGKEVYNLSGGYKTWHFTTLKQSNEDIYATDKVEVDDLIVASSGSAPSSEADFTVDACGLQCPGPVMQLFQKIKTMESGQTVQISATDPGFAGDIRVWSERTGNRLLSLDSEKGVITARLRKGVAKETKGLTAGGSDKTIVFFSGDFDKAMAAFIIANTAASMGKKVTIFFTFWGLNLLRRPKKVRRLKKTFMEKMFARMMPRGSKKFKLSRMNMGGMGTRLMKRIMRRKNVNSLEELMGVAKMNGVRLVACQMTMDIMGLKKEELIDGVETGGAASYLGAAEQSNVNLFI